MFEYLQGVITAWQVMYSGAPGCIFGTWGYAGTYSIYLGVVGYLSEYIWGYPDICRVCLGLPGYLQDVPGGTRIPAGHIWGYASTYRYIWG